MSRGLTYRKAKEEDYDDFYKMKSDSNNISWGGYLEKPIYETFGNVFLSRINSETRKIFIIEKSKDKVGYLCLEYIGDNTAEVSYGVLTEFAGQGIGTYIIKAFSEFCCSKHLIAWVSENNKASEHCFLKNGFVKTEETEERNLPLVGGVHKFYKWEKK